MVRNAVTSAGGNFAVAWSAGICAVAGAEVEGSADWPELAPVDVDGEVALVLHPATKTLQDSSATSPVFTPIFATMLNTFPCLH
jgi:hypothetical protein